MLSKRADTKEKLLKLLKTLWRNNEGPFENLLRLVSYAGVILPGGFVIIALDKIASMFGFGLEDLGRYLDKKLNLGPGANITENTMSDAANIIESLSSKEANSKNILIKNAGLWSFLSKGGVKTTFKGLWAIVKWLLTALALTNFGDLYKTSELSSTVDTLIKDEITSNPDEPKKSVRDIANEFGKTKEDDAGNLINKLKKKYE